MFFARNLCSNYLIRYDVFNLNLQMPKPDEENEQKKQEEIIEQEKKKIERVKKKKKRSKEKKQRKLQQVKGLEKRRHSFNAAVYNP
jgi:hypothetical protein